MHNRLGTYKGIYSLKRNGQAQLSFDVLSSSKMLEIAVIAFEPPRGKPRYESVLSSFYTCHPELFLVARDKRHSAGTK